MKKKGKSICVFSPKGGVGKTILSMNIAGVASLMEKKTLLLDMDLYNGCLSMLINQNINKTIFHLVDDLNNNRYKNIRDYIYSYNENIDILCAPKDPRQGNKINSEFLELILNRVTEIYDLVVVDTTSILNEINIVTMDNSDEILFVVTNDIMHIKNMRNLVNIFIDGEITNYKVLFNASNNICSSYNTSDIKRIIGSNIDYFISKDLFIKNINNLIFDNIIPILEKGRARKNKDDVKIIKSIIDDLFEGELNNEEK